MKSELIGLLVVLLTISGAWIIDGVVAVVRANQRRRQRQLDVQGANLELDAEDKGEGGVI